MGFQAQVTVPVAAAAAVAAVTAAAASKRSQQFGRQVANHQEIIQQ